MADRTERCVCGGYIRAASLSTSRQQVSIHNLTLPHLAWRLRNGITTPDLIGISPHDPRRRWPTADDEPVDPVQGDVGASTDDAEGSI